MSSELRTTLGHMNERNVRGRHGQLLSYVIFLGEYFIIGRILFLLVLSNWSGTVTPVRKQMQRDIVQCENILPEITRMTCEPCMSNMAASKWEKISYSSVMFFASHSVQRVDWYCEREREIGLQEWRVPSTAPS